MWFVWELGNVGVWVMVGLGVGGDDVWVGEGHFGFYFGDNDCFVCWDGSGGRDELVEP